EIERRVEMRMTRQRILEHADPLMMWAIVDEAALRRPFGTTADRIEQLRRLVDADERENVTVQVMPFSKGLHAGMACGFVILTYAEDPAIVYIETGASGNALYLDRAEDLDRHSLRFQHLQATAMGREESVKFLSDLIKELK
ncbi:DUF5753 domain-containing protein, partial [Spirillospora sp. NPDC000708]